MRLRRRHRKDTVADDAVIGDEQPAFIARLHTIREDTLGPGMRVGDPLVLQHRRQILRLHFAQLVIEFDAAHCLNPAAAFHKVRFFRGARISSGMSGAESID